MSKKIFAEKNWHAFFEFGIVLTGINGILKLISGTLILFVTQNSWFSLFANFFRGELIEDPNDRVVSSLSLWLKNLSVDTKLFVAVYLLVHGAINTFLAIQLYREKLWSYKLAIAAAVVFMSYQIYRVFHTHSLTLTLLTIWDIIFIVITWHEYKYKVALRDRQSEKPVL